MKSHISVIKINCMISLISITCAYALGVGVVRAQNLELSDEEARSFLEEAITTRLSAMNNVDIESRTHIVNYEVKGDQYGRAVADSGWYDFRTRMLNGSYRLDSQWHRSQETASPTAESSADYRNSDSIRTTVGSNIAVEGKFARIDRAHDENFRWNRAALILGVDIGSDSESVLRESLDNRQSWKIARAADSVSLTYDYALPNSTKIIGRRVIVFQISKGFMPKLIWLEWEDPEIGNGAWRREEIELSDPVEVEGIWIPKNIEERIFSSNLDEGVCATFTTHIKRISFGVVGEDDLGVIIPVGTKVIDVVDGTSYMISENGAHSNVVRLYSPGRQLLRQKKDSQEAD